MKKIYPCWNAHAYFIAPRRPIAWANRRWDGKYLIICDGGQQGCPLHLGPFSSFEDARVVIEHHVKFVHMRPSNVRGTAMNADYRPLNKEC
jgi:hypothetical protein